MLTRILIANRGEIAVRVIRACRELGISPAAVYSAADAGALHVRLADVAAPVGPAPAAQSYLRGEAIIAAAQRLGAQAIHPGYGFLSENAAFARMCREAGLAFIGPPPEAIEAMGGKIGARRIAVAAGVPVVPGYDGADQSDATLAAEAARVGFPLLVKASAGGGGKGMRAVSAPGEFAAALEGARREAGAAFGDATVFLERYIQRPRHVEIQILADSHGNIVHLGERECSIQRRHQKVIEESPSPALTPALRVKMGEAAVRVARAAGYVNAGTVEFILGPDGSFYFLEMNTRLQVEHPVTELVTGLDLVRLQIAIAAGAPLPFTQEGVSFRGHAIEARLYAEDPVSFLPAVGRLALHEPPLGPGVRVDSGLASGDEVTVHYDPMIAKLIVSGADRAAAIERLRRALDDYAVLGLTTNLPLLRAVAESPAFVAGDTHTGFLAEQRIHATPPAAAPPEALAAAAIWEQEAGGRRQEAGARSPFESRWRAGGVDVPISFTVGKETHLLQARQSGEGWSIAYAGGHIDLTIIAIRDSELVVAIRDTLERFRVARDAAGDLLLGWRGEAYRLARPAPLSADSVGRAGHGHGGASLSAPMPGTLITVLVSAGEQVAEGQPLLVLEAMKMEHTVVAPYAGVVRRLPFAAGDSVAGGADLIELEADED
ncbi:acetyl-CoA carboxylase biotin carboxylase subunit [Oscillochloris sp. ZM17-4]|uniref:acetyl/propionyl/methylcrotonyl-CoA carboxylase subunit alpha n=1 Tax=Oscillochloris sp. ZM17-4 TaxID=2866714 RepID=UPI001C72B516|nr:acetyl-CoA carboxylase biotin carboxylase subunit [Oscillochloris sp. ZM17-4]MBX0326234.1 acetyl-CoA carboxylase biotin carboxylase subunit [Oscillochloris sp. ZM17-4]